MRKYLSNQFDADIPDLQTKWSKKCWSCFSSADVLKKCTGCNVAKYCGKECQKKDWTTHKFSHSELKMTKRMNTQNLSESYVFQKAAV